MGEAVVTCLQYGQMMHMGYELSAVYTMSDGIITTQLEAITAQKHLGVYIPKT